MEPIKPLPYVRNVAEATCFMEHSWRNSPRCKRALTPVVHQKKTCMCYALTSAEATRAVINLKGDKDIPQLSAQEIAGNCHGKFCVGYYASVALEWIYKEGLVENSDMELDFDRAPSKGKSISGTRHRISGWEPIINCDGDIKSSVVRQPVIVSMDISDSLITRYDGGLIDAYLMEKEETTFPHSMLLTGFGYYVFPDDSIVDFWEIKNSFGKEAANEGYLHVIRNSSQPVKNWVSLDPLVPLFFAPGERYTKDYHLVETLSFDQLDEVVEDPNLDIIILFYEGRRATPNTQYLKDFERCSRLYIADKSDVKVIQVNVNDSKGEIQWSRLMKYGIRISKRRRFPLIRTYKYLQKKMVGGRKLVSAGAKLEVLDLNFEKMAAFLISRVGGPLDD